MYILTQVVYPNLILNWYFSAEGPGQGRSIEAGDLEIDHDLLTQFEQELQARQIQLRFFSGAWDSLDLSLPGQSRADIVLSSETVYAIPSLPPLCRVLQDICWPTSSHTSDASVTAKTTLCLIAAKVLYFGVGGGVRAFCDAIAARHGWTAAVRESRSGVGRVVLSTGFP